MVITTVTVDNNTAIEGENTCNKSSNGNVMAATDAVASTSTDAPSRETWPISIGNVTAATITNVDSGNGDRQGNEAPDGIGTSEYILDLLNLYFLQEIL